MSDIDKQKLRELCERDVIEIDYTNYRGERAWRSIRPYEIMFASSKWHPEQQWLLSAWDVEKDAVRVFALKDIHSWGRKADASDRIDELEAQSCVIKFGKGTLVVDTGRYGGDPAVFIAPAARPGVVGHSAKRENIPLDAIIPGEHVLTFPTDEQATAVADDLVIGAQAQARIAQLEAQSRGVDDAMVERAAEALWNKKALFGHWNRGLEDLKERYRCNARAALKAALAVPAQQWRPISEAPRDGTDLLLFSEEIVIGRYTTRLDRVYDLPVMRKGWWSSDEIIEPTHFMLLPVPPAQEQE